MCMNWSSITVEARESTCATRGPRQHPCYHLRATGVLTLALATASSISFLCFLASMSLMRAILLASSASSVCQDRQLASPARAVAVDAP